MRILKHHFLGILACSMAAALIGFGALFLLNDGVHATPASLGRQFLDPCVHAVYSVYAVFFAPVSWFSPRFGVWARLAGILAAVIWGSASYVGFRLLTVAARHLRARPVPVA